MHIIVQGTTKHPEERKGYPPASIFTRAINVYTLRFCPETGVKRNFCKLLESSQLLIVYVFQSRYMMNILRFFKYCLHLRQKKVKLTV